MITPLTFIFLYGFNSQRSQHYYYVVRSQKSRGHQSRLTIKLREEDQKFQQENIKKKDINYKDLSPLSHLFLQSKHRFNFQGFLNGKALMVLKSQINQELTNLQIQQQVDIMKTFQSFKIRNRHLILSAFEQGIPTSSCSSDPQNLPTLSPKQFVQSSFESSNAYKKQSKHWNQAEQRLFIQFWLQKIIGNPNQNFSFDTPLKRKSYNKSVSQYINRRGLQLNLNCQKSPVQCKSKFGTIRRRIQRYRKKLGDKLQFGFIDYILQKSKAYFHFDKEIQVKNQKVKQLLENESPFVNITMQEYGFLKTYSFRATFDLLLSFLEKNGSRQVKIY